MNKLFALVDCNNFYCSAERLFRPDLRSRPVAVMSNNDGCVIARSAEVKALGIKMGTPVFQIRNLIKQNDIELFSSNYTLYADVSARVMATLEQLAPAVEVYSIDEAFLNLDGLASLEELHSYGEKVKSTVEQQTGIPVCVGISTSKTLAKLANHAAKLYPGTRGVLDLTDRERQRKLMALLPADEVWGVGKRNFARLQSLGINTALELADADPAFIRKHFSVVLERTVCELNGESCLELNDVPTAKQQIVVSRSFGEKVTNIDDLRSAITTFASRAAEKLRREAREARLLTVFVRTSAFGTASQGYSKSATHTFDRPTDDSRELLAAAVPLIKAVWREGYGLAKAGVMLGDFWEPGVWQPDLFSEAQPQRGSAELMATLDTLNRKAKGRLFFASQTLKSDWKAKQASLSPAYTTRWSDIPRVS